MAVQKCYYCADPLNDEDMVIKPIPLKTKSGYRNYKRKFHIDCLPKYLKEHEDIRFREQENSDWDQVYQYFKAEILNLPAGANLSKYCVERLLGLRVGKFRPASTNVRGNKQGYSFKTMYYTVLYSYDAIKKVQKTVDFNNEEHEVNYIMKIVTGNINFIQRRLDALDKERKKVEKISKEEEKKIEQPTVAYKRKGSGRRKVDFI